MILESLFAPSKYGNTPGPLDAFWYSAVGAKTTAGVPVTHDSALTYSACWAATRLLAGTAAGLPLKLYRSRRDRGSDLITDHRAVRVLKYPSEDSLGMLFRAAMMNFQVNAGNAFAEIEMSAGNDGFYALHPIHSSRVRMRRNADDRLTYYVRNNDLSESPLAPNEVLHFRSAVSKDGVSGLGVIAQARESIGFGMATEKYGAGFFGNNATPGVILRHPGKLEKEARANLRAEWQTFHQGPQNAHNTAVLWEGMDVTKLPFSPEDSQFLATRQHNIEEIARWYGVPPHMIQHLLRATFSNISHQSIEFVVYSLMPWLQMIEAELDRKLLTEQERAEGYYFRHVVLGLLRGDEAARAAFYKELSYLGVFSPNDICELEDRNPVGPEGDQRFVQMNMVPLSMATQSAQANIDKAKAPAPVAPNAPSPNEDDDSEDESAKAIAARLERIEAAITLPHKSTEQVARRWLTDTMQRMMRKEANEAKRAAKNSGKFFAWLDEFYAAYPALLGEAISGPISATSGDSAAFVREHVEESRRQLLLAAECQPSEFEASVTNCVDAWTSRYKEN